MSRTRSRKIWPNSINEPQAQKTIRGFYTVFVKTHVLYSSRGIEKNGDKLPVGILSCFEYLMVNVSYALT